jgi:hypothetical protein
MHIVSFVEELLDRNIFKRWNNTFSFRMASQFSASKLEIEIEIEIFI